MSKDEFLANRKENGCGGLTAQFTEKLNQNLVEIQFSFISGTSPAEMIAAVSEQFSARPTKSDWSAEIKYATQGHECSSRQTTSLYDLVACVGGLIAKWRLDDYLSLNLSLNRPAGGIKPNEYVLVLSSQAIANLDAESEQSRRREQEMRARVINPGQRF